MSSVNHVPVIGRDGLRGYVHVEDLQTRQRIPVILETGERVDVPADSLVAEADGSYRISLSRADLPRHQSTDEKIVIPLVEETIQTYKRPVETGRVRVTTSVIEREEVIDEPLHFDEIEIDRVPINQYVDQPVTVRIEGDKTIVPVLEEVLYVEKRLMLKEEIHLRRIQRERHDPQRVILRKEEAHVERLDTAACEDEKRS